MREADYFEALIADLEAAGLSRQEIARRSGVSKATIWKFANGEARMPQNATVRALLSLHGCVLGTAPPRYRTRQG